MINRFLIIISFTCACTLSFQGQAQVNLVRDPSFEQMLTCPYGSDQIKIAKSWSCIDTSYVSSADSFFGNPYCSPEYINTCATNFDVSAPYNHFFHHYPRTGNGMADVWMYYNDTFVYDYQRDYLMGRLYTTLTAGQSYCVTFYVVMAKSASYAINHIGAYLDNGSIDTNSHCGWVHTEYTPQVVASSIINDSLNWTKIQGNFIANGTERYLTIGNFFDTAHTAKIRLNSGYGSYYEVDDISVIASNATAYAGPDVNITAGCSTYVGVDSNGDGMPCYWYVLGSTSPIDSGGRILVHPTTTTTYIVSMDLCGTITTDTVTVNVTPCTGPPVASFTDTGTHVVGFTYTGITGCIDSIKWNFGDGTTSTLTDPLHTYSALGTYSVCVTVYTYCGSDSACNNVIVSTLTSPALSIGGLTIFPNPARDELYIIGILQNTSYRLLNITGLSMQQGILHPGNNMLPIKNFAPGIYILEMTGADGSRNMQCIVKE